MFHQKHKKIDSTSRIKFCQVRQSVCCPTYTLSFMPVLQHTPVDMCGLIQA